VYLSWGRTNRSALVRVPRISAQRAQATRVELRCPDPACNPYLAFAVMLKAGLDGIKHKLTLPEPPKRISTRSTRVRANWRRCPARLVMRWPRFSAMT